MHAGILADVTLVTVIADPDEVQEGFPPRVLPPDFVSHWSEDASPMFPEELPPPHL